MPDLVCSYAITTPLGSVVLNNGSLGDGTDKYWISDIPEGLGTAPIRAPIDKIAFGDGARFHTFWKDGRSITFEGTFVVETVPLASDGCQTVFNVMEESLRSALESIKDTDGTLTWTPSGLGARSLTVRFHGQPGLAVRPAENYLIRTFEFGVFAANPDW